ncbi:hypothetical protein SBA3_3610008 [Candidatus Sulfopaludibacter sp. SbA3]|nr:hypothetical protein SBA3_3610008 [Candidatus Sulfopaludibacter sp. SbA3]
MPEPPVCWRTWVLKRWPPPAPATPSPPGSGTIPARPENYLVGRPDLNDTIKRLQPYQTAGAGWRSLWYASGWR